MRISTFLQFETGSRNISRQQAELLATQSQIASGRRIQQPSDDPVGASQALRVSQSLALSDQWQVNQGSAKEKLSLVETRLADAGAILQEAKERLVQAGGGALTGADRASLASALQGLRTELLTVANSQDGTEGYLFSGFRIDTQPFADAPGGVTYQGDQGERTLEVAPGRLLKVSEDGQSVFGRVRAGNGTFTVAAGAGNTGTAVGSSGTVSNPAALNTDTYAINFTVTGTGTTAVTTYDIVDTTTGTPVSLGNAFTPGQAITVAGRQFNVTGNPATGDTFALAPSAQQSIFDTLDQAIAALKLPVAQPADNAKIRNALVAADANLGRGLDSVLNARSGAGSRLSELEGLTAGSSAESLLHASRLSALQDLDYASAISKLQRQDLSLQAAQQTYQRVSQLSLFNYL
ncbi:flagellar hook-associated protein 3 [Betaproteobacteria bacterium GR16-43]|nr:flagellar hook-associated protein 3 [Betaproteobacteria bacterium GR16-43]